MEQCKKYTFSWATPNNVTARGEGTNDYVTYSYVYFEREKYSIKHLRSGGYTISELKEYFPVSLLHHRIRRVKLIKVRANNKIF